MKARVYIAAVVLLLPSVALAATPTTLQQLANMIVTYFNAITAILVVAVLVLFFWGATTRMYKNSKGGNTQSPLSGYLLQGVIALFIMVSVWGIVRLLQASLFGSGGSGAYGGNAPAAQTNSFTAPAYSSN